MHGKRHPFIKNLKKNKYGAKQVRVNDKLCDSKIEGAHYWKLLQAEKSGHISDLKFHPRYKLHVNGELIGICELDFEYQEGGAIHYIDVKGVYTDMSKWKHKHLQAEYGIEVEIWK